MKWLFGIVVIVAVFLFGNTSAHALGGYPKLPYSKGQSFLVTQGYDTLPTHINKDEYALDLTQHGCDAYQKPVVATLSGTVMVAQEQGYNGGYGTEIVIDHGGALISRYAHMIPGSIDFSVGQTVRQGQIIGRVGDTGLVAGLACLAHPGTHLHFAMGIRGSDGSLRAFDPEPISNYRNIVEGKWYLSDNILEDSVLGIVLGASTTATSVVTTSSEASDSIILPPPPTLSIPIGGVSMTPSVPIVMPAPALFSVPPPQPSSTPSGPPVAASSSLPSQNDSSSIIYAQAVNNDKSAQSWYDDNWYDLGSGFSGTLNSLTLMGRVSAKDFFASHIFLQEFKDKDYTAMVQQFTISDNAPFTYDMATTTFSDLSILLKPYFYYRLSTIQDYQNRSVVLAGTSATGTMMSDNFVYGVGRVEYTGTFFPYMIMQGVAATSTLSPPLLTAPTNLTTTFNPTNLQLDLGWSTSSDPDWNANPLNYEINYSTTSTLNDSGWGATLPLSLDVGNAYLLGVRATDNFGDISAMATTTWNFPSGFVPYYLSSGESYANQEFMVNTTTVLDSIKIFTANFGTGARNPDAAVCSLAIFYSEATSTYRTIAADNGFSGYSCAGNLTYSFASTSPTLLADTPYQWIFQAQTGNPSTQASVQFYGTKDNSAGGPFSDISLVNARFILNSSSGVIFAN